jgi:hypothetical protein
VKEDSRVKEDSKVNGDSRVKEDSRVNGDQRDHPFNPATLTKLSTLVGTMTKS